MKIAQRAEAGTSRFIKSPLASGQYGTAKTTETEEGVFILLEKSCFCGFLNTRNGPDRCSIDFLLCEGQGKVSISINDIYEDIGCTIRL